METFYTVLALLLIICASNIMNHFIPAIPVPLFQVALGSALVLLSPQLEMVMNPELFFVLFVAPILFNDGKRVPRGELWNLRAPILMLALGLVFATVFIVGYFINWMIPTIPLSAAFALAAILSPTDAVAVSSLASRINLPKNIMHLIEGEALMNDASGLVAFKFAIAATITGVFSIKEASISFFIIAVGGLLCGSVLAFLIIHIRLFLRHLGMEDVTMHVLIQILTPFAIYLVAEHIGVSGILAVVAGGIVHAIEKERMEYSVKMQIVSNDAWSVILYILNGLVFVILGLQIPNVLSAIFSDQYHNNYQVVMYIILITASLIVLRFLWIVIFSEGSKALGKSEKRQKTSLKAYILTSISGARGAVTLAGAFSIPMVLQDGSPFPERDLIIFISAGVILFTLTIASVFLPMFSDKKEIRFGSNEDKEKIAKSKLIRYIINNLKAEINDGNRTAVMAVIADYRKILKSMNRGRASKRSKELSQEETNIYLIGLNAEKQKVQNLLLQGKVDSATAYQIQNILNQRRMLLSNRFKMRALTAGILLTSRFRHLIQKMGSKKYSEGQLNNYYSVRKIKIETINTAIEAIKEQINDENREVSLSVISYYEDIMHVLQYDIKKKEYDEQFERLKREINLNSLQDGRDKVQLMYEEGEVSREIASKLRNLVNQMEALVIEHDTL